MKNTLTCRLLCPKPIFFCEGNKVLYLNGDITLATLTLHCTILGTSSMIGKLTGCGGGKKKHCHFDLQTATFEHRHENKGCSARPKDQLKHLTLDLCHT